MVFVRIWTLRSRLLLGGLALLAIVFGVAAALHQRESTDKQRLIADIDLIGSAQQGYGIEAQKSPAARVDREWLAYCYRERAALMDEARSTRDVGQ
jgi:hypothetical protein